jgi:AcrR family transcriptional regulator
MPRPKEDQREQIQTETRHSLLTSAIQAFAEFGYDRAKVDAISRAAGFAKGTIYNYFESKQELMLALIDYISDDHYQQVATAVRKTRDPVERLIRFYQAGFAWVTKNVAEARILITTLNSANLVFKHTMYAAYEPMFKLVHAEILAPGIQAGVFRQVDPGSTSGLLMATYLGTCSQVDEHGRPWIDPGEVAEFALSALQADR